MLKLNSYAKINLFLEILGKNHKNYHLLQSLICFIDIYDVLRIEESSKLELTISGKYQDYLKNDNKQNIILRTVSLMAQKFNFEPKLNIFLEKNIPVAAGLGGGSSNAASLIFAINKIYNLKASEAKLLKIGLEIGSDVPIFLHRKIALIEGIGEKITNIDSSIFKEDLFCLIINPNIALSTQKIFDACDFESNNSQKILNNNYCNIVDLIKERKNNLEEVAINFVPEISFILNNMKQQKNCLISRMSGSGASCFALFKKEEDLNLAYDNLQKDLPNFFLKKAKILYKI